MVEHLDWSEIPDPPPIPGLKGAWFKEVDDGTLTLLLGSEPRSANGWPLRLHLSIAHRYTSGLVDKGGKLAGRLPTWEEVKAVRYEFMPREMTIAMILPRPEEYVNVHENCFHLWEIPDEEG